MKKAFLIFCVYLLITTLGHAQTIGLAKTKSTQELHDDYIKRYKTYKTAGWVLLGSGIGIIVIGGVGIAGWAKQGYNGVNPRSSEDLFFLIGPSVTLASIPLFILAKRNKTKAQLLIKQEPFSLGNEKSFKSNYSALALTIPL